MIMSPFIREQKALILNLFYSYPYLSHIHLSEQEEKLRRASLWLPKDTMIKYFNWNPEEKGY